MDNYYYVTKQCIPNAYSIIKVTSFIWKEYINLTKNYSYLRYEERDVYMEKICVIGLGYIGLPTAVMLADNGWQVMGVDIAEDVVNKLNRGEIHVGEPDLHLLAQKLLEEKKIIVRVVPEPADVFIIAVPTPKTTINTCDMNCVELAVKDILPCLKQGNLIIVESTVPPWTCENIIKPFLEDRGFKVGTDIFLAHCPERVLPGRIMQEIIENDRIIGGCTPVCAAKAAEIYQTFIKGEIIITDAETAEMAKLTENTFRDVNIALANEMVKICNRLGINALKVLDIANNHPRVNLHMPGPGVGGHCLAIDPYFIVEKAPFTANLISTAREINSDMPAYIITKVRDLIGFSPGLKIAVLGVSYKGNVSDVRESPALEIIAGLKKIGYEVAVYDPLVEMDEVERSIHNTIQGTDLLLILSDHDEFKYLDGEMIGKLMRSPIVFDTRNIWDAGLNQHIKLYNLGNIYDCKYSI